MAVLMQCPLGDIVVDLFCDESCGPLCESFLKLCAAKYYHGCLFYNVQPNCLAQTGDPEGTGRGGNAACSLNDKQQRFMVWDGSNRRKHDATGLLSMACMGRVQGSSGELRQYGSQFFVTLRGDDLTHLDQGGHAVIGEVAEGLEVLAKLSNLYLDEAGRPMEDVRLQHTYVLDDPFANGSDADERESPPAPYRPPSERVRPRVSYGKALEKPNDGLTEAERQERENEKRARSQAQVLEMVGDLPHADVEVPRNELFVCKLNKVTEDNDLEIIFSRFGKVESCDIVRDWKTGDSLNFAFIAFEDETAAVEAYRKMNGVIIDDSRIKVDFSQSVAKIWSRYTLQYKGAAARERKLKLAKELHKQQDQHYQDGHYGRRTNSRNSNNTRRSPPPHDRKRRPSTERVKRPTDVSDQDEFGRDRRPPHHSDRFGPTSDCQVDRRSDDRLSRDEVRHRRRHLHDHQDQARHRDRRRRLRHD